MRFYIKKPDHLLAPDALWDVQDFINKSNGTDFEIEIKEIKDARTVQQNKFFHGALMDGFVRLGDTNRRRIKRILKDKFLATYDDDGQYIDTRRTRDLDVDEMRIFIDNCTNLLQDYGGFLTSIEYNEYMGIYK